MPLDQADFSSFDDDLSFDEVDVEQSLLRRLVLEQEEFLATEALAPDGYEGGATSEWLVRARKLEKQFEEALGRACEVAKKAQVELSEEIAEEADFLQTRTIPTATAMKELPAWREALADEVQNLVSELEVVERTTQEALDELAKHVDSPSIEYVPSLVVFTRKQGSGRRRARVCACGNFLGSPSVRKAGPKMLQRQDLDSPGLEATLRCQVRQAAEYEWCLGSLDISKAFLTAPLSQVQRDGRLIVVQPPKAAVKLGLASTTERWIVRRALYGLAESPAAWVEWRNQRLETMRWNSEGPQIRFKKSEADPSLYLIVATDETGAEFVKGSVGLYVDDFLFAGSMVTVLDAMQQVRKEWKTSEPERVGPGCEEKALKFLGIQIRYSDGAYYVTQEDFVKDLLQRRGFRVEASVGGAGPMSKESPPEEPEEPWRRCAPRNVQWESCCGRR